MDKIELNVYALSPSYSSSRTYALVLAEKSGDRKLLVIIGEMEAQIIALELENITPPRPLTHDLIKALTDNYDIRPIEVYIDSFYEGIFSSKISFTNDTNEIKVIDSRTSDAIILALKYRIPIYTSEQILESVGIIFTVKEDGEEDLQSPIANGKEELNTLTKEKLEEMLKEAEEAEEYEQASKIMEEIEKKKKGSKPKKKE